MNARNVHFHSHGLKRCLAGLWCEVQLGLSKPSWVTMTQLKLVPLCTQSLSRRPSFRMLYSYTAPSIPADTKVVSSAVQLSERTSHVYVLCSAKSWRATPRLLNMKLYVGLRVQTAAHDHALSISVEKISGPRTGETVAG